MTGAWKRRGPVAVLAALVVVGAGVVLWQTSGEDEASKVRGMAGVATVSDDDSGGLRVRLASDAEVPQVARVLEEIAGTAGVTVAVGPVTLETDVTEVPPGEAARLLVAAAGVSFEGGESIRLLEGSEYVSVEMTAASGGEAPSLARRVVGAIVERGRWPLSVRMLTAAGPGVSAGQEPIAIADPALAPAKAIAMLGAAAALRDREPRVLVSGDHVELRVLAADSDSAGAAWDALAARMRPIGGLDRAEAYVDVKTTGPFETRPVLGGPLGSDPGAALALLRSLGPEVRASFASTDLAYVEGAVGSPAAIARVAKLVAAPAEPNPVGRLKLEWGGGIAERGGSVEDAPATVAVLGPGIVAAGAAGFGVAWSHLPGDRDPAALDLRVPPRLRPAAIGSLVGRPRDLRQIARGIRLIDWPGTASFSLSLGNGTCEDLTTVASLVRVVSTSEGEARAVMQDNDCSSPRAVAAVRRAWNSTATRR